MNEPPEDDRIHELYQDLRRTDAARAPGFDTTLQRARTERPWWRTRIVPIGLGVAMTGAAAAAAVVLFVRLSTEPRPQATAVVPPSAQQPEPLASLLQRPGGDPTFRIDDNPIPARRLVGGWE